MASYAVQDKVRILKRVIEDGESKSFVAASEGCDRHTIDSWIKQYEDSCRNCTAVPANGYRNS